MAPSSFNLLLLEENSGCVTPSIRKLPSEILGDGIQKTSLDQVISYSKRMLSGEVRERAAICLN